MSKETPVKVIDTHNRPIQRLRALLLVCVVLVVIGGLLLAATMYGLRADLDDANADRAQIKADLLEQRAAFAEANERLVEAGEKPVTPPLTGPQGSPGASGRPPTPDEIRDAVDAYCAGGKCRGPAGASVTRGEVAAAVTAFCDARGECRGPRGGAGSDGTDGTDGSDGGAGPQGPPPTDAQVSAAVAAFCADGRCRGAVGPAGPPGPAGAAGVDGRGIASLICQSVPQLTFTVTFSDGTQRTITCTVADSSGQG